ncbi:MAG: Ig-like domain-containing protein [Chloroflexi bacterium]|nr:Ig-like domain-containing protein [Chloroflexota bacterium]
MNKNYPLVFLLVLMLTACNLPAQNTNVDTPIPPTQSQSGPVQILSPQSGANLPAGPVTIQFTATGGPFVEADLSVDGAPVAFIAQDGTSTSISGALVWNQPTAGSHTLTVVALTLNKEVLSTSVQVTVEGAGGVGQNSSGGQTPTAQPTQDAGLEAARQRVIQILHDTYGITVTDPPVGRKLRQGVTTDPWTSAVYYKDWFINVSIYPDGREIDYAYPLNYSDPQALSNVMKPGDKPVPMCRPSGVIKLLVVFVDYQNLVVTQQEALDSLTQAVDQINGRYLEASQAVGLSSPIMELQATGAYLSSPPATLDLLLTPELIRKSTGIDPSQYDILVQVDLDANDTSGLIKRTGSYGFDGGGCIPSPNEVHMWIAISQKDQLSISASEPRLVNTLGHEILHTMGYPIGLTGLHEWVCGDGTQADGTDQCDQNNLPTLMMGWTDTDGDGVVEILDTTPYGLQSP